MAGFIQLTCPACGAPLHVSPDMYKFTCEYCGLQQVFERNHYSPDVMMMESLRYEMDKRRIESELSYIEQKRERAMQILCSDYIQPLSLIYHMALKRKIDRKIVKRQLSELTSQQIESIKAYTNNDELKELLDLINPEHITEKRLQLNKLHFQ